MTINPFQALPRFPRPLSEKGNKNVKVETIKAFLPHSAGARQRISVKIHSIESGVVIGPSSILFGGVYVGIFQPGNCTGWSSDGVKVMSPLTWSPRVPGKIKRSRDLRGGRWSWTLTFAQKRS